MNDIQKLEKEVQEIIPTAMTVLEEGESSQDESWLTIRVGKKRFTVEWKPDKGFGVSSDAVESNFAEAPDHVCETMEEALGQLLALVATTA